MDTIEFEQYIKQTDETRVKFLEQLTADLDSYWVIEESVMGGFLIGCSENVYLKAHAHGNNIIVHRVRTVEDVLTADVATAVKFIARFLESMEDMLRDISTAPVNGKPFLVMIQRRHEKLLRVAYFNDNVRFVGDYFEGDRNVLGWIPIQGIKYDSV
jgi:hypothetical protein